MEKTRAELIADWVERVKLEDVPRGTLVKAKYQIMNVLAAVHAGSVSKGGRIILDTVRDWKMPGKCTIIPTGEKTSLIGAVLTNSSFSMAYDFDDYMFMGHTCHSAVVTSLAVAEERGLSGRDALLAQVVANEVGGRTGASVLLGPHNGQTWSFIHAIESACAAAKLMSLRSDEIANAIAISMYQPNYVLFPGFMGPDTKLLTASVPSVTGVLAAQLASRGFTGSRKILEHEQGFVANFSYVPLDFMLDGFGETWVTDSIAYKKYPGCAYVDTTADCLMNIMEQFRARKGRWMEANDVDAVTVNSSMLTVLMDDLSGEHIDSQRPSPVSINFSIPLSVALTLLTGRLATDELKQEYIDAHRDEMIALSKKVTLTHNWSMTLAVVKAMDDAKLLELVSSHVGARQLMRSRKELQANFERKLSPLGELVNFRRQTKKEDRKFVRRLLKKMLLERSRNTRHLGDLNMSELKMPFPAEVILRTKNGEEYRALQTIPVGGGYAQNEAFDMVTKKFRTETSKCLSEENISRAIDAIKNFEKVDDAGKFIKTCCVKST